MCIRDRLKRAIQRELETTLGRKLLAGEIRPGDHVLVGFNEDRGELTFAAMPAPPQLDVANV